MRQRIPYRLAVGTEAANARQTPGRRQVVEVVRHVPVLLLPGERERLGGAAAVRAGGVLTEQFS